MRFSIPEGGDVLLHVPAHIGLESLEMAEESIALQMRIFKRHAEKVASTTDEETQHG